MRRVYRSILALAVIAVFGAVSLWAAPHLYSHDVPSIPGVADDLGETLASAGESSAPQHEPTGWVPASEPNETISKAMEEASAVSFDVAGKGGAVSAMCAISDSNGNVFESEGSSGLAEKARNDATVEAISIALAPNDNDASGSIQYRIEDVNGLWSPWTEGSTWVGTYGTGTGIRALKAQLEGDIAESHCVLYRVRGNGVWSAWVQDGEIALAPGDRAAEALEVQVVAHGSAFMPNEGAYRLTFEDGASGKLVEAPRRSAIQKGAVAFVEAACGPFYRIRSADNGAYLSVGDQGVSWSTSPSGDTLWLFDPEGGLSLRSIAADAQAEGDAKLAVGIQPVPDAPATRKLRKDIGVPAIMQYPELPTGCEAVALTEALNYYGFDLAKTTIADRYMLRSARDFITSFMGNPHLSSGRGIMAPGLAAAANRFLGDDSPYIAEDLTGAPFDELLDCIDNDSPVVIWTTMGFAYPAGRLASKDGYVMHANTHCVTLSGYDMAKDTVIVADPLVGTIERDRERFERIYTLMGSQAVVVRPRG